MKQRKKKKIHAPTEGSTSLILGWGTKISNASVAWPKKINLRDCTQFSYTFKKPSFLLLTSYISMVHLL